MKNISKLKNSTESAVKCGSRLVACRTEDAVELVAEVDAVIAERDQLRAEAEALRPHITELLEFIFDRFGSVQHAAELTDQAVAAVRALEPFAAMAAKEGE